ncbi:MAG: YbhB/YbcL family Raf kinase inhibitor-like protein [Methanomicrobiales archaeon]|nr:YbhB/YbcL family Raf kinase inhibitor-like protein [Methanomicrobiales archaeon]
MVEFIQTPKNLVKTLHLTSDAFSEGKKIPSIYTCKGQNISPGLSWKDVPEGTKSLILIMDDPNSSGETISHWVIYNIPPDKRNLPSSTPPIRTLPDDSLQGVNDFRKTGYTGPCPKHGERHQYHFHLYGIDIMLYPTNPLPHTVDRETLLKIIEGHVLGYGELTGYVED